MKVADHRQRSSAARRGRPTWPYDEPETYLHPPQARALGRYLSTRAKGRDLQLLAVIHDRDFVIGLMKSKAPLQFVRVAREGVGNRLTHVNTSDVEWIWKKAVLRHSNVLDGLFYNRVVIREGEADCHFYAAVLDGLLDDGVISRRAADALFVSAADSGGIAVQARARALAMLHVRTSAIVDVDFLADDPKAITAVVDAAGRPAQTDRAQQAQDHPGCARPPPVLHPGLAGPTAESKCLTRLLRGRSCGS